MQFENTLSSLNKNYSVKKPFYKKFVAICFAIIFVVALVCMAFYSIFFEIEVVGVSMQPTYNELLSPYDNADTSQYKDVVMVNSLYKGSNGDVVIIKIQEEDNSKLIIKRLIATGGQELALKKNTSDAYYSFYLNGQKIDESYLADNKSAMNATYFERFLSVDGVSSSIDENGNLQGKITIPEGKIFVLGDNRGNSSDSINRGCLDVSTVIGTVVMSYKYNENTLIGFWHLFFG